MTPIDPATIVPSLPAWFRDYANLILFGLGLFAMVYNIRKGHGIETERQEKPEIPNATDDILDSSLFGRLITAFETLALHAPLHTEALKTIAASQIISAKLVEEDFDELRIFKAVQEQLKELEEKRQRDLDREETRRLGRADDRRLRDRDIGRAEFPP